MEKFWNYSVRVYAIQDVSTHCLKLQDSFDFDVNLILYCCWYASTRGELDPSTLTEACTLSSTWSTEVVQPMRRARRWMKTPISKVSPLSSPQSQEEIQQLRQQIKKLELQAEMLQENMLESLVVEPSRALEPQEVTLSCIQNWKRLCLECGMPMTARLANVLQNLLLSVIPDTPFSQQTIEELLTDSVK